MATKPESAEELARKAHEATCNLVTIPWGHPDHNKHPRGDECRLAHEAWDAALAAARSAQLEWDTSYLISCPWCGKATRGEAVSAQIGHLVRCGDKHTAAARREALEEAARLHETHHIEHRCGPATTYPRWTAEPNTPGIGMPDAVNQTWASAIRALADKPAKEG